MRARHPLRIERPIQRPRLAPPRARGIDRVHLECAVPVGGEVDAAFAPPARRLVAPVAVGQIADRAAREIEREQIVRAAPAERRAVGRKDDRSPIRADGGVEVLVAIRSESLEPSRQRIARVGEPQSVEIRIPGLGQAAEHDALGVGRPGRRENRDERRKLIAADDLAFLQIPEEQRVALGVLAAERRDALRIHVDPRLEEVEGFELLAALPLHHRPPPPPVETLGVDRRVAARGREEQE